MRLICPRCGAQYEVETAAIPANGREVECSACDHVWRASRTARGFDPADRPALSRELSESVIGILREEAARELQARAAEQSGRTGRGDVAVPPAPSARADARTDAATGDLSRAAGPDPVRDGDTPPAGAHHPAPGAAGGFSGPPDGAGLARHIAARGAQDAGIPDRDGAIAPVFLPAAPARAAALPPAQPQPQITAATAIEPPPARRVPARAAVQPADMPVAPAENLHPAASPTSPQPGAVAPRKTRSGYAAGFRLAVIAALAAAALYALAPRLADQGALGQRLAEWRAGVDQGRDWLAARADALMARGGD